ncbi:hypothetical protein LIER_20633 [Lithospermum erythrorhizon]|uniref:Reverse transcriptase Ty1/copia-type domain-containing protein n=1 Tax=Lithospermum erythrorhizon TaxID=34254 RepID=A0AAV3QPM0_LITER
MTDMGMMRYFLGLEVLQTRDGIFISQKKFACDILKKFRMMNSKPVTTPIVERMKLSRDEQEKNVNVTAYKSFIGSLRRSKHIDIKYHKIQELVAEKEINVEHCSSESQVANIFTKPLKMETFFRLKKFIAMINVVDLV